MKKYTQEQLSDLAHKSLNRLEETLVGWQIVITDTSVVLEIEYDVCVASCSYKTLTKQIPL